MKRIAFIVLALMAHQNVSAAIVEPLMPEAVDNDEAALAAAARAVVAEELEGGYRQFDLTVAAVATWDGRRNLPVRLLLPAKSEEGPYPLVAHVHGGGFIGGSPQVNILSQRRGFSRAKRALLDEGFAIASLGYRRAREAGWPAPISDTLCGLRFLAAHGEHWNIDASRIGLTGHSAGARIVAMLGMVPRDRFHVQGLPWQDASFTIGGVWMWAGSAWDWPQVQRWTEYGKPRNYSVPRLLFGEHPAWDTAARHRLRLRYSYPHLSRCMPPLHMVRGESDYGGDHSDADRTVAVWRALGREATLSIVPGGHSATGPDEPLVAFFKRHLTGPAPPRCQPDPVDTARRLLAADDPAAAMEVLNSRHTRDGGRRVPDGDWMILHDGTMLWLAHGTDWPEEDAGLLRAIRRMLAEAESAAAQSLLARRAWFAATEAARNAAALDGDDEQVRRIAQSARAAADREAEVFKSLARANELLHDGRRREAVAMLGRVDDPRLVAAAARLEDEPSHEAPQWAEAAGTDVYGRWADLRLGEGVTMRLRWVEPGRWELPDHLWFRNRTEEPWQRDIEVQTGFWLAQTPTTVAQWHALSDPDRTAGQGQADHDRSPKAGVDYLQIVAWLERLSARHPGMIARLPSEQQWLHAATCGGRNDVRAGIDLHAVHALSVDPANPGPGAAGAGLADLGGFHGMLGGVQEWTASPGRNAARFTDEAGRFRVIAYPIARGGAWSSMPHDLGLQARQQHRHGNRQPDLGFRLAIGSDPDDENWLGQVER